MRDNPLDTAAFSAALTSEYIEGFWKLIFALFSLRRFMTALTEIDCDVTVLMMTPCCDTDSDNCTD